MSEPGAALIWCPFPSLEEAERVARSLLEQRLVACANILPDIKSVYIWDGELRAHHEVGVLFKTEAGLLNRATTQLAALHSYDVPAVAGWIADAAPAEMRAWLAAITGPDAPG